MKQAYYLREDFKRKLVEFSTKRLPPLSGKKIRKKMKNDLRAMKRILYDMGPLTLPTRVAKNISVRGNLDSLANISPEIASFTGQLGLTKN